MKRIKLYWILASVTMIIMYVMYDTSTPPLFYVKENEKGFCVISDGGNGNNMKRFKVTIEDYKNKDDSKKAEI
jgi:hypothetical protein